MVDPSLLKLLCRMGEPSAPLPTPIPIPIPGEWPNIDRGESVVANGLWRSMEPVGLRRRVGLLPVGGEPMPIGGGRLIRALRSSAPVKEPDEEAEEFKRKEKRSKRDPAGAGSDPAPSSPNSFMRSFKGPVSGREPVRKSVRWAILFSNVWSTDDDLELPKMTLLSRREPWLGERTPLPLNTGDWSSSGEESEDFLSTILLAADALRGKFRPLIPSCCCSCW